MAVVQDFRELIALECSFNITLREDTISKFIDLYTYFVLVVVVVFFFWGGGEVIFLNSP